jgi:hypothetical protein
VNERISSWRLALGWGVGLLLPPAVLLAIHQDTAGLTRMAQFMVLFLLAMIAGKIGKWMTGSPWDQSVRSVVDDAALSIILSVVAYEVAHWMLSHGGGLVNPLWAALAGAYLVMLWPIRA